MIMTGALLLTMAAGAQVKTEVREFRMAGPYAVATPFGMDTVDVQGNRFDEQVLLGGLSLTSPAATTFSGDVLPSLSGTRSVGLLSFYINNQDFLKGKIVVEGPKSYKLFIDGTEAQPDLKLAPEHHTVAIKFMTEADAHDSISVVIEADRAVACTTDGRHPYMVHDLTDGRRVRGVSLSADGAYVVVTYQTTERGGNAQWSYELREVKTGRLLQQLSKGVEWMPRTAAYLEEEWDAGRRLLTKVDPATGQRSRFATDVPKGGYTVSPTEDYLIITAEEEGPKEDEQVYQVLEMDDRQPGWRKRTYLMRYDLSTGLAQRITFGNKGEYLQDISQDGRKLLISTSRSRLERRPTEVSSFFVMDAQTLAVDTILCDEGFLSGANFSPDGRQLFFIGNPEAFDRIGCQLPPDVTPNATENELYIYDLATRQVRPMTKDFDPSVGATEWSWADGQIYFAAEDRDYVHLFRLDPVKGKIVKLPLKGDYIYRFNMAKHATTLAWLAYNTMEPASAYVGPTPNPSPREGKRKKAPHPWGGAGGRLLFDGKTALGSAEVGTCQDWNYLNSRGDSVYGRLYLPKDFDASKKYPMIVYYYGGCSPVSRYFESPYAPQMWNSLGYVAYIVEPSGATGFGQEWASRHVNTAGRGPAEDIIEGVRKICEEHPFINKEKIGCMGASYGGFMTQYLQTVTDIFACAVSHAGIANHTSYWGEGYWGYNYSEVSMANSYPWSHRQLYVDQSPLFNADKIHTPLLLLHGDADTNVPVIESLQMFTALKLLGREVALVEVKGENHHILDYAKKEKWLATQMAWFQRWLKDDPSWWDALYPPKHL